MIHNYIKISLRYLLRNKTYTGINIFSLAFGLACTILIINYVLDELSYDRFHADAERIYRIEWYSGNPQTRTPHPMAQEMVSEFPDVEHAVSLSPLWGPGLTKQTFSIRNLDRDLSFNEEEVLSVDTTFFDVFSFPVLKGNPKKGLKKMGSILISESMAVKYFGEEDPMGKFLAINDDTQLLEVTAVFKDIPLQSHIHFDFLVSYPLLKSLSGPEDEYYTWKDFGHYNYVKLQPDADVEALEKKLLPWAAQRMQLDPEVYEQIKSGGDKFRLTPLTDIHLKSNILWELKPNGNINYIYILTGAAFLILLIACTNFINLTTARSADRAREIGIRKSIGAYKHQLMSQFISESVIICIISLLFAGLMVELFLPMFSQLSGKDISNELLRNPTNFSLVFLLTVFIGILSGIYPALYLSSIKPGKILKGKFSTSKKGKVLRETLVVAQFTISMILISSTIVIYDQLNYLQNKPLGYNKEEIMVAPINSSGLRQDFQTLKTELKTIPGVAEVTAVSNSPGYQFNQNPIYRADSPEIRIDAFQCYTERDLVDVLDLQVLEGRYFDETDQQDELHNFVINETAAKQLGAEVGSELILEQDGDNVRGTVIGLIKDFNFQSLHQPVRPIVFMKGPYYSFALLKISTKDINALTEEIKQKWMSVNDDFEFQFAFLDERLDQQYRSESKMGGLLTIFTVIAILIACMGLFGLAVLSFHQRLKEVGVRKILGASLSSLLITLNKEYARLIALAIILAIPIAMFIIQKWLNNFTFKTTIDPASFFIGAFIIILIAIGTLTVLTLRATSVNPVQTLKED